MSSVPAIVETMQSVEQRLADCERRIEAGFVEAGKAFREIRDGRLYPTEYGGGGFDAYCRERWGMSRDMVDRLIKGESIMENLTTNCQQVLPANEGQIRPLARLEPEQQVTAWTRAVESAGDRRVTARHVEAAVEELYPRREEPADEWEDNPSLLLDPAREPLPGQGALPLEPAPRRERQEIIDVEYDDPGLFDDSEANDLEDTRPDPTPAPVVPPTDAAADKWYQEADKITTFLVSIPRRGGADGLIERWSSQKRIRFAALMGRLAQEAMEIKARIEEIEGIATR